MFPDNRGTCDWFGEVILTGFNFATIGTIDPHGQLLSISSHVRLYEILGNQFGGSQSMGTFGMLDLQGKAPGGLHYYLCDVGRFPGSVTAACSWRGQVELSSYGQPFSGTAAAHGELLDIASHPYLLNLYGFKFGGSQATRTFGVPNLRGQAPPGLRYRVCTSGPFPPQNAGVVDGCNWLGQVVLFGFDSPAYGTLPADGRLLSVANNSGLSVLYGNRFGANGTTEFAIPNLRGKAPSDLYYRICTSGAFHPRA